MEPKTPRIEVAEPQSTIHNNQAASTPTLKSAGNDNVSFSASLPEGESSFDYDNDVAPSTRSEVWARPRTYLRTRYLNNWHSPVCSLERKSVTVRVPDRVASRYSGIFSVLALKRHRLSCVKLTDRRTTCLPCRQPSSSCTISFIHSDDDNKARRTAAFPPSRASDQRQGAKLAGFIVICLLS